MVETNQLLLPVWEEDEPKKTFYMFDPSSRGPTGMPQANGTACLLSFESEKMLADHFMSLIPEYVGDEFTIRPVEIVVGKMKTKGKRRKKRNPCDMASMQLQVKQQLMVSLNNKFTQ